MHANVHGRPYAELVDSYIVDFDGGASVETKQLSELEQDVGEIFPTFTQDVQCAITYHWDKLQGEAIGFAAGAPWGAPLHPWHAAKGG